MQINLDIPTAIKTAIALVTLGGMAKGGYEGWKEYELQALNIQILQCQVAELRNAHMKKQKIGWDCHKIALRYAGMLPPDK
jgi:hypothetical protein